MSRLITLTLVTIFFLGFSGAGMAQEVTVVVKGSSWDSDSLGLLHWFGPWSGLTCVHEQPSIVTARRRGYDPAVYHTDIQRVADPVSLTCPGRTGLRNTAPWRPAVGRVCAAA
jgi:hypothetical protein